MQPNVIGNVNTRENRQRKGDCKQRTEQLQNVTRLRRVAELQQGQMYIPDISTCDQSVQNICNGKQWFGYNAKVH